MKHCKRLAVSLMISNMKLFSEEKNISYEILFGAFGTVRFGDKILFRKLIRKSDTIELMLKCFKRVKCGLNWFICNNIL